jgi:hypothetical protein
MNVPEHNSVRDFEFWEITNKKGEDVMNKRHVFYVGLLLLAAAVLLGAPLAALAAHPDVTLKDTLGAAITNGTSAYSPKNTCGGCHFDCASKAYSDVISSWCQAGAQKDCTVAGNCPDYESMAVSTVNKTQGILQSNGTTTDVTYSVAIPLHGASTGKHSTQGRNEGLTAAQRTVWGAPANISSPGMWGRF